MAQRKFIIDGGFAATADSEVTGNLEMTGHILPTVDSDGTTGYDLGSTSFKWRDLYLSEGSLYINNQKVIEDNSGTIVVRADSDQSLTVKTEGTGVLTLQSAQTVNLAATLQMAAGKKITDAGGNAVQFGDKVDMDNNQIINVAAPTADGHAANKSYVDDKFDDVVGGAPAALDTLNELANALGDDANYAASITTALSAKAAITYVDAEVATAISTAGTNSTAITDALDTRTTALESAQATNTAAISANATALSNNATSIANNATAITTAKAEAISTAGTQADAKDVIVYNNSVAYTDAREVAITSAYTADINALDFNNVSGGIAVTGGDLTVGASADLALSASSELKSGTSTIVGDDPDNAGNPAVCASSFRPTASVSNLNLRPNTGGAIDLDGGDVTYGAVGIIGDDPDNAGNPTVCASTFRPVAGQADLNLRPGAGGSIGLGGNVLEGVSTPVAGTDASNKTYVDTAKSSAISTASSDATSKANAAQAAAESTASSDATSKANAAEAAAEAYTDARETAITTAYQNYANQAEADAETAAAADASAKANQAEANAVATAATDATTKANAAQAAAEAHADTAISNLVNGASSAFDTLSEIQSAMATDAELTAAINALTIGNATLTVSAGSQLTGGGTFTANATSNKTITVNHGDTSTLSGSYGSTADGTKIDQITVDGNGHVTAVTTGPCGDIKGVTAGSGLSGGGTSGTPTLSHADTSSQASVNNSGATVIQDVTLDGFGHVSGLTSHTLTLGNLGYTGATNANYITNNNQLTNGAGYTTNVGDITSVTAGDGLTGGATSGGATLNVVGGNGLTVTANAVAMSGSYTGTFTASGDICAYSDESLKTNIMPIGNALNKVEQVRGVTFDRVADGSTSTGVVAQELEAVLPEAVHTDANGTKMVAYGNITGLLIEAVKELSAEVAALKAK